MESSSNKKSKTVDFELCFICQLSSKQTDYSNYVLHPSLPSVEKLITTTGVRWSYGEREFSALKNRIQGLSADELLQNGVSYHKTCYKDLTHKTCIDRAKTRYEKGQATGSISDVKQKTKGRPPKYDDASTSASTSQRSTRSQTFDKEMCVICQEVKSDKLHNVTTENMGAQLKVIGQQTDRELLKVRLGNVVGSSDLLTAVAEDIKYHLLCLSHAKRDIEKTNRPPKQQANFAQLVSDLEMLDMVETEINDPSNSSALNMNDIERSYVGLLESNAFPLPDNPRYKPYLKQLIMDNIADVHFTRPPDKTKPEQVLSTKAKETLIAGALATDTNDLREDVKVLLKAAKILRRDISSATPWKFEGTFDNYEPPALLHLFCKHAIQGLHQVKTITRAESMNQSASVLAQHFVCAYKSDRQVTYETKQEDATFKHRTETPLSVGLALDVHKKTRSKVLVETLGKLHLTVPYNKVMQIETAVANAVLERMKSMEEIYRPPWLVNDMFVWFALDNIDFLESTPSGMNTLHGTATAIYQTASDTSPVTPLNIDRSSRSQTLDEAVPCEILSCDKPIPTNKKCVCTLNSCKSSTEPNKEKDMAWVIGCLDFNEGEVEVKSHSTSPGTWGAFNSLLSPSGSKTNIALVPPLIRLPPTKYDTLFTGLMRARAIATHAMGPESITVMTLDLQLYDMAMKLWMEREDIKKQFLFRPGELHIVFWALAALGKYVEGSGIDQAWVEAGLYSPTTVTQILNGKHMYRALEAHTVTLLALYSLYFQNFLQLQPDEEAFLKTNSTILGEAYQQDINTDSGSRHNLRDAVTKTIEMFESRDIFEKIKQSEGTANKIQRFIANYMKQFETILQFVRATRQRDILLHMQSLESLIKYFFAHDHLNYARLLPLYMSTMQQTEKQHPEIWAEFMKGNFCVTKGVAGFTSIGPDHGIEQENRELKVIGGIVGITQNEKSLDKYFLIAPELSNLQHEFEKKYCIGSKAKRTQHHELTGGKLSRITQNAVKLSAVFNEHGNPFESADEDEIYNLLSKAVMNDTATNDILRRDEIGQEMFEGFVTERLTEGKLSVWDKMTKRKLNTFKSANAMTEIRVGDKVVKIKEERGLLQRFIVISRSRPELDLKECIGTYEFGVVPRSLFASDGSLLLAYDKASILHHLEKLDSSTHQVQADRNEGTGYEPSDTQAIQVPLQVADTPVEHPNVDIESAHRVIIIDAMAVVNSVIKTEQMKTCQDFADAFLQTIYNMAAQYDEVRLVFDRYIKTSLKEQMRTKRTKGKSTYYHVKDNTLIQNIALKDFLSDIRTKGELTEYLADKVVRHSKSSNNRLNKVMVTSGTETKGNVDIPDSLRTHSQEEADTLLILHALTVSNEAELVVSSPDTDVLLLLVYIYTNLPLSTTFLTGKGKLKRNISVRGIYNNLGPKRASALLGFHALTGSDMSGRFAGRTKDSCFKAFMSCDDDILDALAMLGNETDLSADVCSQLERFVCILYRSKIYKKVNELRWFLYSNRAAEGENLPPTSGSLDLHIRRAHYITMIWRKSSQAHPCLPAPAAFGWALAAGSSHFSPVRCLNPPAPEAVLHLIKCGCKRGCEGRCSCRKNNIPCTEVCGCWVFSCNNTTVQPGITEDCDD